MDRTTDVQKKAAFVVSDQCQQTEIWDTGTLKTMWWMTGLSLVPSGAVCSSVSYLIVQDSKCPFI